MKCPKDIAMTPPGFRCLRDQSSTFKRAGSGTAIKIGAIDSAVEQSLAALDFTARNGLAESGQVLDFAQLEPFRNPDFVDKISSFLCREQHPALSGFST